MRPGESDERVHVESLHVMNSSIHHLPRHGSLRREWASHRQSSTDNTMAHKPSYTTL